MTTETMTVHKALSELKILDSRIQSAITGVVYCEIKKNSSDEIKGVSVEDFKRQVQGGYDKAVDLIKRQKAIKRAVALSNAVTEVNVAGETYKVCEAIAMKNHGMAFDKTLLHTMKEQYSSSQSSIEIKNGIDLEERADEYIKAMYGQSEINANPKKIEEARALFMDSHRYTLVDPLNIVKKMEEFEKKIDGFMTEVDAALSVSNAVTEITIEY